jgi:hypothetical protein
MRGWSLVWTESEEVSPGVHSEGTITLANAPIWSDLRAGTLITLIETSDGGAEDIVTATDLSYDPAAGDWWINVATTEEVAKGDAGVVTTVTNDGVAGEFSVGNRDWTLTIFDASGTLVFGPAGEGATWGDGVNGSEGGSLEGPMGDNDALATLESWQAITPESPYYDDTSSTSFGAPNVDYDDVRMVFVPIQDVTPLRALVSFPFGDGDFDDDGQLTAADIDALNEAVRMQPTELRYDVTQDGYVNGVDRTAWVQKLKRTYLGDADLDGAFTSADLVQVFAAGEYEDAVSMNSGWSEGDWNGDGDFDTGDVVAAFQEGGYELGPRSATRAVPEPSTAVMGIVAIVILALRRRRAIA